MNFIKIGKLLLDLSGVDMIDLEHYEPLDNEPYVRIQLKNRRDEIVIVAGKPQHIKHGVVQLPKDLSDKFRWFIKTMGRSYGVLDIEEIWDNREQIMAAMEELKRQKAAQASGGQPAPQLKPLGRQAR